MPSVVAVQSNKRAMQEIEPDEHQLQIERGGTISMTLAHDQAELAHGHWHLHCVLWRACSH
jgi:hypothetical protein